MPLNSAVYPTNFYESWNAGVIPPDVFGIAINWFVNRTPLFSRVPKLPVGSVEFRITNDNYRPSSTVLANGSTVTNSATSFVVADASTFLKGDLIQIENEVIRVTADPTISSNTLTVSRGYGGTTAASHVDTLAVYLIGNARLGNEINQTGISRLPAPVTQYCQTIQHPYQVGGSLNSTANYVSGLGSPLQRDKMMGLQHAMDDFERSAYYGAGQAPTASLPPAMKGLKNLIATNKVTSPTNAGAYKPDDLIRDTVQACFANGGKPDTLLVSTNFLQGLAVWSNHVQRLAPNSTIFGDPVDTFAVSFLPNIDIVPSPLLRPFTAVALSSQEVRARIKRPMVDYPRGRRGDAEEGDIILEAAIELDNEAHHAWVEGITAFSAV
ncbi:Family of unknown function (DUF5309) [uncultured Caudovirales phage]|uniref:Uncharacterized protein n=1 Tax=uncultured Caudovirales phage TaxID=2100421 RepID=A0A6J5LC08_9CAUD|nr:Family of unknown function (DUF5309) [uncultured Caudovirales phage]